MERTIKSLLHAHELTVETYARGMRELRAHHSAEFAAVHVNLAQG
jgi:hypothetical protein